MGVEICHDTGKSGLGNMGVDLGGRNARMTEQLLNQSNICTTVEEVGGKAMP